MKIYFSDVFKKLRLKKNLTQEQIADIFCVSPQAVSRWECGTTTPDITLLPTMAEYFDISIEELLGAEKSRKETRIQEYIDQFESAMKQGKIYDCIEIARAGVQDFPNNYALLNKLMYALFVSGSDDGDIPDWRENMEKYKYEIIELGEKILHGCTDDAIRLEAKSRLGFHYCEIGEPEKGKAIFEALPSIISCKEYNIYWSLRGEDRLKHICNQTIFYTYQLVWNIWKYVMISNSTIEEKLNYMDKMEYIVRVIYDEDDLGSWYYLLPRLYIIGKVPIYLEKGDTETALQLIEKSAEYLEAYEKILDGSPHTAPLLRYAKQEKSGDTADSRSQAKILYEDFLSKSQFDAIKNEERFIRASKKIQSLL